METNIKNHTRSEKSQNHYKSEHIQKRTSGRSAEYQKQKKKHTTYYTAQASAFLRELQEYEKTGTRLYLNDRQSRAHEIVNACMFAEKSDYMRDLISDENEHITEIHFIRIPEHQQ